MTRRVAIMKEPGIEGPAISIGMPIFNGARDLAAALDSLSRQTLANYELIISDNCSTDATQAICEEYRKKDARIRVIRQPTNIGASKNFRFVLDEARAKYFMWAAADDVRSEDFLEVNFQFLERNSDYVSSTSPVRFQNGTFDGIKMGDASLVGDVADRIGKFLLPWHANGRFYALIRTQPLKACPHVSTEFFGSDWAVTLYLLLHGKTHRHQSGEVVLGRDGISNSGSIFKRYRRRWIHWVIPLFELGQVAINSGRHLPLSCRLRILASLTVLNVHAVLISTKISAANLLRLRLGRSSTSRSHEPG